MYPITNIEEKVEFPAFDRNRIQQGKEKGTKEDNELEKASWDVKMKEYLVSFIKQRE